MDRVTKGMSKVEEEKGGMEWWRPCILENIDKI
jgi:hypothetical protein